MQNKKLVVTIPAFNEESNIGLVVKKLNDYLKKHYVNFRIHVIDDGSTDLTKQKAVEAGAFVTSHNVNKGLAEAFRTEMREALLQNPDVIVHFDADGQYDVNQINLLVDKIWDGYEFVLGSRFKGFIEDMPFKKKIGNQLYSVVISLIAGKRISDAQSGFRVFVPDVARIGLEGTYTYTQEQVIKVCRNKFKYVEVPINFFKRGDSSRLMRGVLHYAKRSSTDLLNIFFPKTLRFFNYAKGRVITAIIGCVVLYFFADRLGFPAWITNMFWIPASFILSFLLYDKKNRKV